MNIGDMVLASDTDAAIWTGASFDPVPDAQISLDPEAARAVVRVGATPVPPTGVLILNAPGFAGWTGFVSVSDGRGVARDPREDNATSDAGGGDGSAGAE